MRLTGHVGQHSSSPNLPRHQKQVRTMQALSYRTSCSLRTLPSSPRASAASSGPLAVMPRGGAAATSSGMMSLSPTSSPENRHPNVPRALAAPKPQNGAPLAAAASADSPATMSYHDDIEYTLYSGKLVQVACAGARQSGGKARGC